MAFAQSIPAKPRSDKAKVDIVCVPAIGADPGWTWARNIDRVGLEHDRVDHILYEKLFPNAQVHLYDHLTREERALEIRPPRGSNDEAHKESAIAFADAEERLANYGVSEWADRFLEQITEYRRSQETERKPIFFICHSTGGIVVKQALSRKATDTTDDLAAVCLGVTFFSTPHHGSSVLSGPEYVRTVKDHLGLKWEMSETLRQDLRLRNQGLEILNYKFAVGIVGVKIYSYVETNETPLVVLSTNDSSGEALTTVHYCIVDIRSGKLGTAEVPIEDEEFIPLSTTHVGAPRFADEDTLYGFYVDEISDVIKGFKAEERAAYYNLDNDIMTRIEADVHQFYEVKAQQSSSSIKILSAHPSLRTFFELGPSRCMRERINGMDGSQIPKSNGFIRPSIELRSPSEPQAPTFTITRTATDEEVRDASKAKYPTMLSTPPMAPPKNVHTRPPSIILEPDDSGSPGHLNPQTTKTVQFRTSLDSNDSRMKDVDQKRLRQRAHLFPLPNASSDRFKWIHVPFNHAGWVPHVLTTISQEKEDLSLHSKVLMDKIWFSLHNRSRHGAPHARFVRPSVKCLLPQNAQRNDGEGLATPSSAINDTQLVVYLPYLHWDSFKSLEQRASIINRRREQAHARPTAKDIALGRSMEHKLIWQYLTSDRPVHCRRTLDQYGYPSLRNTSVRDADQILYKRTRVVSDIVLPKESKLKNKSRSAARRQPASAGSHTNDTNTGETTSNASAKVLMVDQMWLWIIDGQTVITFFPPKEKEDDDDGLWREGDLRNAIYQDINGDYANQCADPFDFAALAVSHAVRVLLEGTSDRNLQVFRIFEEYISILTEQQTSSFKHFRNNHMYERAKDTHAQSHIDNRIDLDALLELRDIDDELSTIHKLIKEQQTCVQDMIDDYSHLNVIHKKGMNGTNFLREAQEFLNDHKEQLISMLNGARIAQRAFKDLLDMKQKQANIVEAHFAREQNEVAAEQSRSVMIFTIFTIIFLPLSFFASVFGIQSREWAGGNYPKLHTIFTYMGSISLAVIIIALLVAFNRYTRRVTQRLWKVFAMPFLSGLRRLGIIRLPAIQGPPPARSGMPTLDLEKAAAVDKEAAQAKRLSMISRTHTKMNWEEELRLHRQSVVGF